MIDNVFVAGQCAMASTDETLENETLDYDAELMKEAIASDEVKAPSVNVESDYERSKRFSVSEGEATEVSPSLGSSFAQGQPSEDSAEGNPENFRTMAQEVSSDPA